MEGVSAHQSFRGVIFLNLDDVSPEVYRHFSGFLYQVLLSVQPRKRIFSLLRAHQDYPGDEGLRLFLRYFNSNPYMVLSRVLGNGRIIMRDAELFRGLKLRRVYTDIVGQCLIFLSASRFDLYHEKMVLYLRSVALSLGLEFVRDPFDSRYSGYDLEIKGLNVEFESGLKASYRDLEDRIALSRSRVVIVVPNQEVLVRYLNHFHIWEIDIISLLGWESFLRCNSFL